MLEFIFWSAIGHVHSWMLIFWRSNKLNRHARPHLSWLSSFWEIWRLTRVAARASSYCLSQSSPSIWDSHQWPRRWVVKWENSLAEPTSHPSSQLKFESSGPCLSEEQRAMLCVNNSNITQTTAPAPNDTNATSVSDSGIKVVSRLQQCELSKPKSLSLRAYVSWKTPRGDEINMGYQY